MLHIQPGQIHPGKLSPPPKNSILKPGSSAALSSQMFSALIRKDLLEDSHEKASNVWRADLHGAAPLALLANKPHGLR